MLVFQLVFDLEPTIQEISPLFAALPTSPQRVWLWRPPGRPPPGFLSYSPPGTHSGRGEAP